MLERKRKLREAIEGEVRGGLPLLRILLSSRVLKAPAMYCGMCMEPGHSP